MKEKIINAKVALCTFFGFLSARLGITGKLLAILFLVVIIDYISGVIASGYEGKLSSKAGYKGILKKLSYFVAVASAMVADYLIRFFFCLMEIDFNLKATLAALLTVWLILNELLSVMENVKRMEVRLPEFLEKTIVFLIGNVEKKGSVPEVNTKPEIKEADNDNLA